MPAKKAVGPTKTRARTKRRDPAKPLIDRIARERFRFDTLREGQREAIEAVLDGRDTLVVKPTGSGKSAIYQIAGLVIDGPTVIVSPLIALQKDQVDSIRQQDVAEAAVVNSAVRVSELRETFQRLEGGTVEYLFLAPEQLQKPETMEKLQSSKPSLFVIDEAHCISEWGHDFRPDYLKLGAVIESLGHPVVLAMTATASPLVRQEIIDRLGLRDPCVIVRGFDRPNIWLGVRTFDSEASKRQALLDAVEEAEKPGIIYVATRRNAEEISAALTERGVHVVHYHGGMPAKERVRIQNDFMGGGVDLIVATNAFGMGVDKPNVRFVFHADISDSIDSYYQEVGRAGRDGLPAKAVLFYRPENLSVQKFFKAGGKLDEKQIRRVAELVQNEDGPVDLEHLKEKSNLSERKLTKAVSRLEEVGAVETTPDGEIVTADDAPELDEAAKQAAEEQRRRREYEQLRLEKMQAYAELLTCRREYLLTYFAEGAPARCDHCDNCTEPRKQAEPAALPRTKTSAKAKPTAVSSGPFAPKTRVVHKEWGRGVVETNENDKITILFDEAEVGRKTLAFDLVKQRNLLEPVA